MRRAKIWRSVESQDGDGYLIERLSRDLELLKKDYNSAIARIGELTWSDRNSVRYLQQTLLHLADEFVATDCPPLDEESVRAFADFLETHLPVDSGSVSRLPR